MYTELYTKIANTIIDAKELSPEDISEETTLSVLELDSLDYVEIMVLVKREFDITINFADALSSSDITLKEFCLLISKA